MITGYFRSFPFNIVCRGRAKVACLLLFTPAFAYTQQDCGTGAVRQARRDSLRQAGTSVLAAIKQRDTKTLLSYLGSGGIGFGPDKPQITRKNLITQFAHKEGAYCLFWSTTCIPAMGRFRGLEPDEYLQQWKISYFDWLRFNNRYTTEVELADDDGIPGCMGDYYTHSSIEMKNAPDEIELEFSFERGRWWFDGTVAGVP